MDAKPGPGEAEWLIEGLILSYRQGCWELGQAPGKMFWAPCSAGTTNETPSTHGGAKAQVTWRVRVRCLPHLPSWPNDMLASSLSSSFSPLGKHWASWSEGASGQATGSGLDSRAGSGNWWARGPPRPCLGLPVSNPIIYTRTRE